MLTGAGKALSKHADDTHVDEECPQQHQRRFHRKVAQHGRHSTADGRVRPPAADHRRVEVCRRAGARWGVMGVSLGLLVRSSAARERGKGEG